jgi:predicted RNase H-like HicB family nuclease
MQISVLVERVAGNGYRARGAEPFGFSADGATREEAVANLQQMCQASLKNGAEVVTVEVGPPPHPWAPFAGMFKDDPDFEDVVEIMAENRRKMDEDPTIP